MIPNFLQGSAERGAHIVEAIDRERHRIHRLTGTTKDHFCRLTWEQFADWWAAEESWRAKVHDPFYCYVTTGRSRQIEGVLLQPLLGKIKLALVLERAADDGERIK